MKAEWNVERYPSGARGWTCELLAPMFAGDVWYRSI
jgi:hypothetical protein